MTYPPNDLFARFGSTPPTSKAYDRPDFHRGLDFARRFARKGREMAPVYAGWDDVKVILLATSPLAEADCAPFMTRGPDPLWASMATPQALALPNSHKAWSPMWLWGGAHWLRRTVGAFMTVG